MPKHKVAKLTLRVRAAEDPNWNADSRADAAEFDRGWTARQSAEGAHLPLKASRGFIAGFMAAEAAWNARHHITSGIYR